MKKNTLFLFSIFLMVSCSTRIDSGHEGILVKQYGSGKGVQDVALVTGRVWYNPWSEDVYEFPVFVQTADYEPFQVNAKDGSVFTIDPTITFRVLPGRTPDIFKKYRKSIDEITKTTLLNYVRDAYRIQFNKYTTDSLISNREGFENAVQNQLKNELDKEGFELAQMTSGLTYPESITAAIDAKNKAVQTAMQVENELKITEASARKQVVESEANARALVIQAESEAKAYELRQRSLTPLLIQQQFIQKWDGKLPVYGQVPTMFTQVK